MKYSIIIAAVSYTHLNLYTKFRLILPALVKNAGVVDTRYKFY